MNSIKINATPIVQVEKVLRPDRQIIYSIKADAIGQYISLYPSTAAAVVKALEKLLVDTTLEERAKECIIISMQEYKTNKKEEIIKRAFKIAEQYTDK